MVPQAGAPSPSQPRSEWLWYLLPSASHVDEPDLIKEREPLQSVDARGAAGARIRSAAKPPDAAAQRGTLSGIGRTYLVRTATLAARRPARGRGTVIYEPKLTKNEKGVRVERISSGWVQSESREKITRERREPKAHGLLHCA